MDSESLKGKHSTMVRDSYNLDPEDLKHSNPLIACCLAHYSDSALRSKQVPNTRKYTFCKFYGTIGLYKKLLKYHKVDDPDGIFELYPTENHYGSSTSRSFIEVHSKKDVILEKLDKLMDLFLKFSWITAENFVSRRRFREYVDERTLFCGLTLHFDINHSSYIGKIMKRDHASVIHLTRKHLDLMTTDNRYKKRFESLIKFVNNS